MSAGYFLKYVDDDGLITDVSPSHPLPTSGSGSGSGGGIPVGGAVAWADKTITSLSGSSQLLAAANAARKGVIIKNGAASIGLNILGGTALIGGAATMTLQPYEGLSMIGAECPAGAITVIGTAANYVSAFEAI